MLLSEIFNHLSDGELSQLALGNGDLQEIEAKNYRKLINYINLGLTELYKRFPIKIKEVVVQQYDHIATYYLHTKYAQTNTASTETYKYIVDYVADPFDGQVFNIEAVFDEDGQEVPLNDEELLYSIFTPQYNAIQVPYPELENALSVSYRSGPTKIDTSTTDIYNTEVDVPEYLLEPLLTYIAYKAYAGANYSNGQEGVNIYSKFLAQCNDVDRFGLTNKDF